VIALNQEDGKINGVGSGAARDLPRRVASALVLAPVVLLCTYLGGSPFLIVCALAACAVLWEWTSLVAGQADMRVLVPGLAALLLATALVGESMPGAAIITIIVGAAIAGVTGAMLRANVADGSQAWRFLWMAGGAIYAGVTLLSPVLLRADPEFGLTALLFLFAIVWATDICAYFVGRAVGGPLLWPRLSPKKTWSGAAGGALGGIAAGILVAYASGGLKLEMTGVLALLLSVVAQGGDLFESAVKRRFGAKDASGLIPGHGGVMDRLDGFLVAALVAVVIGILRQSMAAPAHGLLLW
jgi:phosphatidate cytidylyltransferase